MKIEALLMLGGKLVGMVVAGVTKCSFVDNAGQGSLVLVVHVALDLH